MVNSIQDILNLYQQLRQNPVSFLAQRKYNIPQGMTDPSQITQHLLNTGQVNQQQVNQIAQSGNISYIGKLLGFK